MEGKRDFVYKIVCIAVMVLFVTVYRSIPSLQYLDTLYMHHQCWEGGDVEMTTLVSHLNYMRQIMCKRLFIIYVIQITKKY